MWEVETFDRASSGSKKCSKDEAYAIAERTERMGDGARIYDPKGKVVFEADCL